MLDPTEFGYYESKPVYLDPKHLFLKPKSYTNVGNKYECQCCGCREELIQFYFCPKLVPCMQDAGFETSDVELGPYLLCPHCQQLPAPWQMLAIMYTARHGKAPAWIQPYVAEVANVTKVVRIQQQRER